jgi:hypothetical protein
MKRLDCAGLSGLDREALRVILVADATGPSLLCPSLRVIALHHIVLLRQTHNQFAAILAGITRLFAQPSLKLRNAIFQGGDAFAVRKHLTDIFSEKAERFGNPTDFHRSCDHGSAICFV